MSPEKKLKCVVSGSFSKFKPEIDRAIDELTDLKVTVLAPNKGWLLIPPTRNYSKDKNSFRPLPSERGMDIKQIEDAFLSAIKDSDFVYVINPDGYIGNVVSFELGFAMSLDIPIYSQFPISNLLDPNPDWAKRISDIPTVSIQEAIRLTKAVQFLR